ncbi:MAG: hypothetical protein IPK07_00195 [Deltaproteobacteria bacterium]|nr:hypothetical protein [Deltaproteobacteria bacterium]
MSGCATGCGTCGVRLHHASKLLHAETGDIEVKHGDRVVIQLDRGQTLARVVAPSTSPRTRSRWRACCARRATRISPASSATSSAQAAVRLAEQKLRRRRIDVRLVRAEYMLDGSRVEIYYLAEERHVPGDIAHELSVELKAEVELKPLGPRDRVKMHGAVGVCGRETCCSSWMEDFHPVSVKMAKLQDFSLNDSRLMGICGRLKCCLAYENAHYDVVKREMPKVGAFIDTEQGEARVWAHHVLKRSIAVRLEDGTQIELPIPEGGFPRGRRSPGQGRAATPVAAQPSAAVAPEERPAVAVPPAPPPATIEAPEAAEAGELDDGVGEDGVLEAGAAEGQGGQPGAAPGGERRRRRRRRRRGGGGGGAPQGGGGAPGTGGGDAPSGGGGAPPA